MSTGFASALERLWHGLLAYAVKFGVVGLIGLVIDVTLFNLLRLGRLRRRPLGAVGDRREDDLDERRDHLQLARQPVLDLPQPSPSQLRARVRRVRDRLARRHAHRARLPLGQPPLARLHEPPRRQHRDERRRPRARHRVPVPALPLLGVRPPPRRRALEPRPGRGGAARLFEEPAETAPDAAPVVDGRGARELLRLRLGRRLEPRRVHRHAGPAADRVERRAHAVAHAVVAHGDERTRSSGRHSRTSNSAASSRDPSSSRCESLQHPRARRATRMPPRRRRPRHPRR